MTTWSSSVDPGLRLVPATFDDEAFLLALRNDPDVRAVSRSGDPVSPEEHRAWLRSVLARPDRHLYVVWLAGARAGTVRLDLVRSLAAGDEAEVSITLTPEARHRGLGPLVLDYTVEAAARLGYRAVQATVLPHNPRSLRAFLSAGFRPTEPVVLRRWASST